MRGVALLWRCPRQSATVPNRRRIEKDGDFAPRTGAAPAPPSPKESDMKIRPAAFVTVFAASSLVGAVASADIGFPAAVDAARAAAPKDILFSIRIDEQDKVLGYEADLFNLTATLGTSIRLDLDTGEVLESETDAVDPADTEEALAVIALLPDAQIDFADAIDVAATEVEGGELARVQLEIEAGILTFQVEYSDGTEVDVDAVTGGIIPHHADGDDFEETMPSAAVQAAVATAEASAGPAWTTIGLEVETEKAGNAVEVLFVNAKSGMLAEAVVIGDAVVEFTEFTPAGAQAAKVDAIRAALPLVARPASAAVGVAEAEYPGAGINEVEIVVETEGQLTSVLWKVSLITVDLIEVDFFVDAMTAGAGGLQFATAPVNFSDADFNRDGAVNAIDLADLLSTFGAVNPPMDLSGNGTVDAADLAMLLSSWSNG